MTLSLGNLMKKILNLYSWPSNFIFLLLSCLRNVTYTPIFNGKKCDSFCPERGIKQGDPISPYIFILCIEYLSKLIKDQIQEKDWNPLTFKNKIVGIFHLDDILIFCKANKRNIKAVHNVLNTFCKISGMEINNQNPKFGFLSKSRMTQSIFFIICSISIKLRS